MNIRSTLVNEYTVGGSLLLVGFGFFSTRFADILSYQVTTMPSMIPVIGGASVTVGRILGIVPATLGLAVLFRKAKDVPVVGEATDLPVVKTVVSYIEDLSDEMGGSIEASPAIVMEMSAEEMAAEMFCAECDDYAAEVGGSCGAPETKNAECGTYKKNAQGYDDKMDEHLGDVDGPESSKSQSEKSRRDEAAAMDKDHSKLGRKYDDVKTMDGQEKKKTTGSPKQQAWRSCVAQAKGDMAEAKRLYGQMEFQVIP